MQVLSHKTLKAFWETHPDAEDALTNWFDVVEDADWTTPNDVKAAFSTASFLADNRVVFNIRGNHYRLIVRIAYRYKSVQIKFIGTHAEYDKIDANTIHYEK